MRQLSNRQLRLDRIPNPDSDLHKWVDFAHTIDGYAAAGSFEACADLSHHTSGANLTDLRCALFCLARTDRHSGGLSDVGPDVRVLLRRIRDKVASGALN